MQDRARILEDAAAAVSHFQYLLDCGALDSRKDEEHVVALQRLLEIASELPRES